MPQQLAATLDGGCKNLAGLDAGGNERLNIRLGLGYLGENERLNVSRRGKQCRINALVYFDAPIRGRFR